MRLKARLIKLEEYRQRRTPAHFTPIVRVPADIADDNWRDWLARQPCPCGKMGCEQRRVGAVVSERLSPEAWVARYARYRRQPDRRPDDAA
jgi:hypothetical protein